MSFGGNPSYPNIGSKYDTLARAEQGRVNRWTRESAEEPIEEQAVIEQYRVQSGTDTEALKAHLLARFQMLSIFDSKYHDSRETIVFTIRKNIVEKILMEEFGYKFLEIYDSVPSLIEYRSYTNALPFDVEGCLKRCVFAWDGKGGRI
jgi:hypothetical protein